jgi:hypothetical protein
MRTIRWLAVGAAAEKLCAAQGGTFFTPDTSSYACFGTPGSFSDGDLRAANAICLAIDKGAQFGRSSDAYNCVRIR